MLTACQSVNYVAPLTGREVQVLRLVAQGMTARQVACSLGISRHTVHRHTNNIYQKLRCSSRTAAVVWAFRQGLVK